MRDGYRESREFFSSIASVLLAGDIKATVVANGDFLFVKVHLISGGFVLWSPMSLTGWVGSAVNAEGVLVPLYPGWPQETEVEQVAKSIATFSYEEALDFPMEHPADLELDFTQPVE